MGKLSRTKGANFERSVARRMNVVQLGSADFARVTSETQEGNAGDVKDRNDYIPLVIQCKHRAKINVNEAVREADAAVALKMFRGRTYSAIPVAWCRWQGGQEIVAMRPEHFFQLLFAAHDALGDEISSYPWYLVTEGEEVPDE